MTGAAALRPDCRTLVALLRAAFHAQLGLAAVRAVQAGMAAHNVQPNIQLTTAMLCCLQHMQPGAAAPPLRLQPAGPGEPRQQAAGSGSGSAEQRPSGGSLGEPLQPQQHAQQHALPPADQRAACLAKAAALVARQRRQWGRKQQPLDVRLYNAWMAVQLAAGDYAGVLQTFQELEGEERLLPDGATLATVIAACRAAGWPEREAQFQRLMHSSRLLGSLGGPQGGAGGSNGGGAGGRPGRRPRRRTSHGGSGGHMHR